MVWWLFARHKLELSHEWFSFASRTIFRANWILRESRKGILINLIMKIPSIKFAAATEKVSTQTFGASWIEMKFSPLGTFKWKTTNPRHASHLNPWMNEFPHQMVSSKTTEFLFFTTTESDDFSASKSIWHFGCSRAVYAFSQKGFSFDLHQPPLRSLPPSGVSSARHTSWIGMEKVKDLRFLRVKLFFTRKSINVMRLVRRDFFVNNSYQISLNLSLIPSSLYLVWDLRESFFVISSTTAKKSGT